MPTYAHNLRNSLEHWRQTDQWVAPPDDRADKRETDLQSVAEGMAGQAHVGDRELWERVKAASPKGKPNGNV